MQKDLERKRNADCPVPSSSGVSVQAAGGLGIVQWLFSTRPQVDATLTYAQMLEYLQNKRATRLLIYDDGKKAISTSPVCPDCNIAALLQSLCCPLW